MMSPGGARLPSRQRGIGLLLLVVLGFAGFFVALTTVKVYPPLYENFKVRTSLSSLAREPELASMETWEIRQLLRRRLEVNNVRSIDRRDVAIEQTRRGRRVEVDYEVRFNWFMNVDLVFAFNPSVEVKR